MKKYVKFICVAGIMAGLLTGCSKTEQNPMEVIYTNISNMQYEEALTELENIETNRKNRQEIARMRGICYMGMGRYEEAIDSLEEALSYHSGFAKEVDFDINQYLAVAYFHTGQYEEAGKVYQAIAELRPKDAEIHYLYGVVLLEMGDYQGCQEAFDQAVLLEPSNYDRIIDIYNALYKYGYGTLGEEYVRNAMNGSKELSDYDKGRMLYHTGQYNQAISCLKDLDKEKYKDAILYLGMSYEALGDFNYAANVYQEGIGESTNPVFYNQLGLCQMKCGAYEEALAAFELGLECEDNSLQQALRFNQAVAYEYVSNFEKAKSLMEAYVRDYPNDKEAQREYMFLKTR